MRPVLCLIIGSISLPVAFWKLGLRNQEDRTERSYTTPTHLPTVHSCIPGSHLHRCRLIFIRHGQYNVKGRTADEKVLTNLGWMQAYAAGRQLRRLGIRIDRLIHSDMVRARQSTAAFLVGWHGESENFFDSRMLTNLATPNPLHHSDSHLSEEQISLSKTIYPSDDRPAPTLLLDNPYEPYPGANFACQQSRFLTEGSPPFAPEPPIRSSASPSTRQLEGARIEQGFRTHIGRLVSESVQSIHESPKYTATIKSPVSCCALSPPNLPYRDSDTADSPETIVFVGHANVFRFWLCRALKLPPEAWLRFHLQHGSISTVDIYQHTGTSQDDCVVLARRINETGHLPKHMLSR